MKTKNRLLCLALVLTMLLAVAPAAAADSKDSAAVPQQMYTRHGMIGNENPHTQTDVDFPMLEMMLNRYAFFNFYCDEACTVRIEVDMITSSNPDVAEVVINSGNSAVHMKAFGTTILSAEMDGVVYQMEFSVVPQDNSDYIFVVPENTTNASQEINLEVGESANYYFVNAGVKTSMDNAVKISGPESHDANVIVVKELSSDGKLLTVEAAGPGETHIACKVGEKEHNIIVRVSEAPKPIVNPFTDVADDSYYLDAVIWALTAGVTTGLTDTTFGPDATCTRAQAVTFLWRAMGSPEPASTANPFTDVAASDYFYKPVLWAVEQGITNGTSATTFSPNDTVTRGHTITFLYRAMGKPAAEGKMAFGDVTADAYYYAPVLWASNNGVAPTSASKFYPTADCPRAQIVYFIYNALNQ